MNTNKCEELLDLLNEAESIQETEGLEEGGKASPTAAIGETRQALGMIRKEMARVSKWMSKDVASDVDMSHAVASFLSVTAMKMMQLGDILRNIKRAGVHPDSASVVNQFDVLAQRMRQVSTD
jgi:hypothetical protein